MMAVSMPPTGPAKERPTLAVWKFASCDGCQLSLLDCEDELLALAEAVRIVHFSEMSRASEPGPYDVSLVEGSITTPEAAERILEVRASSRRLITIGACATAGGIQGLINFAAEGEYRSTVYAHPEYIATLGSSTPIAQHVPVDFELHGCPIDRGQLLEVLNAALAGRRPVIPGHSVCQECKARGTICLLVARGLACLGPVTRAGCGALCPSVDRGCFGCFGPADTANTGSLSRRLLADGAAPVAISRLFRTFNAGAPAFRDEATAQARVPVVLRPREPGTAATGAGDGEAATASGSGGPGP
jgi:sulfhydrogenase subunit delta